MKQKNPKGRDQELDSKREKRDDVIMTNRTWRRSTRAARPILR